MSMRPALFLLSALFSACSTSGSSRPASDSIEYILETSVTATGDTVTTYGRAPLQQIDQLCLTRSHAVITARNGQVEEMSRQPGEIAVFHELYEGLHCPTKLTSSFFLSTSDALEVLPAIMRFVHSQIAGKKLGDLCPGFDSQTASVVTSMTNLYSVESEGDVFVASLRVESDDGDAVNVDIRLNRKLLRGASSPDSVVGTCSHLE